MKKNRKLVPAAGHSRLAPAGEDSQAGQLCSGEGNATEWYVREGQASNCCLPVSRLFKFNFGSVAGGSFLNAFFNFIDFLF